MNLLCSSRIHPSLSAHASIFGIYDYNRTPITPPGTQVVAHSSAESRTTFGTHGHIGCYIDPSLEHYRCYKVYFPDTLHECDVLKVDLFPQKFLFLKITNEEYLRQTAEDMLQLLRAIKPTPKPNPLTFGAPALNAFREVTRILGRSVTNPATLIPHKNFSSPFPVSALRVTPFRDTLPRVSHLTTTPPRVPFQYNHAYPPVV